jgi:hypothetical protein
VGPHWPASPVVGLRCLLTVVVRVDVTVTLIIG